MARLGSVLRHFPPVEFAMAYGSVVRPQTGHDASRSMLDFVFAVKDARRWHELNLIHNKTHYSAIGSVGGPGAVVAVQGSGVCVDAAVRPRPIVAITCSAPKGTTTRSSISACRSEVVLQRRPDSRDTA